MNRKIKFRGKSSANYEWLFGYLSWYDEEDSGRFINNKLVYSETIGQFTGICDKNGKEIYEGDVLAEEVEKMENGVSIFRNTMYVVFNKFNCSFELSDKRETISHPRTLSEYSIKNLVVIGNIYEGSST